MTNPAVLLMAYGSPETLDDVPAYLADIRRGRPVNPSIVEELKERYSRIGGRSPLLEITKEQAVALQAELSKQGIEARVYFGMKHWHPYIREVIPEILKARHDKLVALPLAPHYSSISVGGYKRDLDQALTNRSLPTVDFVESWHDNQLFHQAVVERVEQALTKFPSNANVIIIFTAHSLPERILESNDPYPIQLLASCRAVANLLGIMDWSFAYQSASQTGEKWLGPDVMEVIGKIGDGVRGANILVVPIGFVADHLEVLYDIDVEAKEFAKDRGLTLKRTESLNADATFINALADIVRKRLAQRLHC